MSTYEYDPAICELARLASSAHNPKVVAFLKNTIAAWEAEGRGEAPPAPVSATPKAAPAPAAAKAPAQKAEKKPAAKPAAAAPAPIPKPESKAPAVKGIDFNTISNFSWDQTDEQVKVYVDCVGVSKDMVKMDFTANSFDMQVIGLNGKNYRCGQKNLFKEITPETSSFMVPKSQKRVVIKLQKASTSDFNDKKWTDIKLKDGEKAPGPAPGKDDDPTAGIMNLMKNLYEEGDDNMKRTIAKAWTESREGKTPDIPTPEMPDMGDLGMGGMPGMGGMGGMPGMPDLAGMGGMPGGGMDPKAMAEMMAAMSGK